MAAKKIQSPEVDLDRTDQLPILEGVRFDPDVEDDAVRMEHAAAEELPSNASVRVPGSGTLACADWPMTTGVPNVELG